MYKIHPLTYLLIFVSTFTGKFKLIVIFLLLIIIHELGHFLTAKLFNWRVDKIYIYPLGGITRFNDKINKPFIEELLVTIMGPIFQMVITILFRKVEFVVYLSRILLFFNLLPIVPLDGGRILTILLFLVKPYKKCINYIIKFSYITYLLLILFTIKIYSLFFLLVIFLLIFKINDEKRLINYSFNKFILERFINPVSYRKTIIIDKLNNMYKYKKNIIKKNNKIYSEYEYIKEKRIVKR